MKVEHIEQFNAPTGGRGNNDENNNIRETVIAHMASIDKRFFEDSKYGDDWINFTIQFHRAMRIICPAYQSFTIERKGGRRYNYDYLFRFLDAESSLITEAKVEFKYNATIVTDAPQFVSPMNPSRYLSNSFEEFHYDHYLVSFLQQHNLPVPNRSIYLKTVGNNLPACMKEAQELYYKGAKGSSRYTGDARAVQFHNQCKCMSHDSIAHFISETDLQCETLSRYLVESQHNKLYLLYKNGVFYVERLDPDDYIIQSYVKCPTKGVYQATTRSGKKMNILLRWKNGNGIAYPAFQIS